MTNTPEALRTGSPCQDISVKPDGTLGGVAWKKVQLTLAPGDGYTPGLSPTMKGHSLVHRVSLAVPMRAPGGAFAWREDPQDYPPLVLVALW